MRNMEMLASLDMVKDFTQNHHLSFLYISRTNCSVCHALLPPVRELLLEFPLIQLGYVNADDVAEIAGYLSIFTVPVLLLFVDGKELIRDARFVHLEHLHERIQKIYRMSAV